MLLCYAFKGAGKVFAKEQFAWMQKNICAYCLHKFEAVFILMAVFFYCKCQMFEIR